jgi:hypothetical protein
VLLLLEEVLRTYTQHVLPVPLWRLMAKAQPPAQAPAPGAHPHEEVGSVKGGQYPDAEDTRSSEELRTELEILERRKHVTRPGPETLDVERKIKDLRFELIRRKQHGIE